MYKNIKYVWLNRNLTPVINKPNVNFLFIGVQKSSSSSFIHFLKQNKDIFIYKYEAHFFDKNELNIENIKNYESLFNTKKLIVGEKTPSYCYLPYCIDRIFNYNPNIKLILFLREPISRAYSAYNMYYNSTFNNHKNFNNLDTNYIINYFEEEKKIKICDIKNTGPHILQRGYYDEIIEYIYNKFPRKNIKILIYEEIIENYNESYNDIFSFLGANKIPDIKNKTKNRGLYKKDIDPILFNYLHNIFKFHNNNLYKILGRKIDK